MRETQPIVIEPNPVGTALKALRDAAGMTLESLSEAAGISPSYLSRAENGQVKPTAGWVELVAIAVGTHIAESKTAA